MIRMNRPNYQCVNYDLLFVLCFLVCSSTAYVCSAYVCKFEYTWFRCARAVDYLMSPLAQESGNFPLNLSNFICIFYNRN